MNKWLLRLSLTLILLLCSQCDLSDDEDSSNDSSSSCAPAPSSCITKESDVNAPIQIEVFTDSLNPNPQVEIYAGTITGSLVYQGTFNSNSRTVNLPCGSQYSAKATYIVKTKSGQTATIYAYDQTNLSAHDASYCEGSCYSTPLISSTLNLVLQTNLLPDTLIAQGPSNPGTSMLAMNKWTTSRSMVSNVSNQWKSFHL